VGVNVIKYGKTDPSSKYGLSGNLDEDIKNNNKRYCVKKEDIAFRLAEIIMSKPAEQEETIEIVIELLKEYRKGDNQ